MIRTRLPRRCRSMGFLAWVRGGRKRGPRIVRLAAPWRSTLQCSVAQSGRFGPLQGNQITGISRLTRQLRKLSMSAKKQYRIAVIPGDGIGKEVVPEGLRVLEAAARFGFAGLSIISTSPRTTIMPSMARCCPRTGRRRSARTMRSSSARSAGPEGAGSHFALGFADPVPARVRPVCQSASRCG